MSPEKIVTGLTAAQTDGLACVVCGLDYQRKLGSVSVPVGRSAVGAQVFACVGRCVETARVDSTMTGRRMGGGCR